MESVTDNRSHGHVGLPIVMLQSCYIVVNNRVDLLRSNKR